MTSLRSPRWKRCASWVRDAMCCVPICRFEMTCAKSDDCEIHCKADVAAAETVQKLARAQEAVKGDLKQHGEGDEVDGEGRMVQHEEPGLHETCVDR